ncbi:MAG: glycosyltransferase family 2 protein [Aureliella sp.]
MNEQPVASVVVPTYRRPDLLGRCLAALAAQQCEVPFEVLVADDANSDQTRQQLQQWTNQTYPDRRFRYLAVTQSHGPAAARNVGWRAAVGEIIAFTDDDTVPDPAWLAQGFAGLNSRPQLVAASGKVVVPLPEKPTDYEKNESNLANADFVTANCFVRRAALEAIGGLDEDFKMAWREDSDLHFRLLEYSGTTDGVGHFPEAIIVHPVRKAQWGISLRQQRKAFYNALLYRKHPQFYRRYVQARPPWKYYAIVASLVGAVIAYLLGAPWPAAGLLAIYIALTLQFCWMRLRSTSRRLSHVAEMAFTSLLIPPLSIYWRLRGAWAFRVFFL